MEREVMELCTRKCVSLDELKGADQLTIPQRSCFRRCSIKFMEGMRFTRDMVKLQSHEIEGENKPAADGPQQSLM